MAKEIKLTQGQVAIVDDADYERLAKYKWYAQFQGRSWYAFRKPWDKSKKRYFTVCMHREIMGLVCGDKKQVDHINHDGLYNRKSNLRICTATENRRNQQKTRGSSKYKGVSWFKRDKRWMACIKYGGKTYYLGYFDSETDAAKAYDEAAMKHHQEFACLNFPAKGVA